MHPKIKKKIEAFKNFHKSSYLTIIAELKINIKEYPNIRPQSPYKKWTLQDMERLLKEMELFYREKFEK